MSTRPQSPRCYVAQLDLEQQKKLEQHLKEQDFAWSQPPHTLFQVSKQGLSCTLYRSGKLTVQGKDMGPFIEYYLEPEILKTFTYCYATAAHDYTPHAGVDEAGKGDYFGPLCIAGVYAEGNTFDTLTKLQVCDSKKLSDVTVLKIAAGIRQACPHSVVVISPPKYNELHQKFRNLNYLLAWGHSKVIENLQTATHCKRVIIDQFAAEHVVKTAIEKKNLNIELVQRTKAEEDLVVAAASILARAAFLEGLKRLGETHGVILPKGASAQVILMAKQMVAQHGPEILGQIAKLHFKTTQDVLS